CALRARFSPVWYRQVRPACLLLAGVVSAGAPCVRGFSPVRYRQVRPACAASRLRYRQVHPACAASRRCGIGRCALRARLLAGVVSAGAPCVSASRRCGIGSPTEAKHMAHVEFSSYEGFTGLPDDWEDTGISAPGVSKRVFAVPISKLRLVPYTGTLFGTQAGIPRVLITLRHALKKWRAAEVVYIFRSCAEETECRKVMEELDAGEVMAGFGKPPSMTSVHTAAGLLTRWYRQMPVCILDAVSLEEIAVCSSADAAATLAMRLPDQERALLEWLIDILAEVAAASDINKMTPKNLGLVVAPSLKRNGDPIQMLLSAGKIAEMVAFLIEMRLAMTEDTSHTESQ
ncbi:hypothetical protein CYMTET_30149, partial [Cymbomonas tetramitiformis]